MKTNNKLSAYILRGSTTALLFSCVIVALCSAIHVPEQGLKALPPQHNAAFGANAHQSRTLSFAERVAYQRAIEEVYWRHRIWPKERPDPKPSLDAVMSQAQLKNKVEGYLRNSQALEGYWQRPITADQLQTEMDRMASHTKQPQVLRELFETLGNDPFVIAECLARPVLTERLVRDLLLESKTSLLDPQRSKELRRMFFTATTSANGAYTLPKIRQGDSPCTDDTWTATTTINAPTGRSCTAVWTGTDMIVWGGFDGIHPMLDTGGRYNASTDSWTPTSIINVPTARDAHTAVWTGSEMIVWGGADGSFHPLNTGGRYNPVSDTWVPTSIVNAPTARGAHAAVWSGTEMIIWGGDLDSSTGGRYNPSADSWTPTSITNAPSPRFAAIAVWTGSKMIVWGGTDNTTYFDTGGIYDPGTDSWMPTSTSSAPAGRYEHTAVWSDSEMIVWGGYSYPNYLNTGGRYNPSTDSWTATNITNAPDVRTDHTAVWTGSEMIVWGGFGNVGALNTGGKFNPGTNSWTATTATNAPEPRFFHAAVWTGSEMILWGGAGRSNDLNTGGRYCAQSGPTHPALFSGEVSLGNGIYYLQFPNGTPFGYYAYLSDPHFIYHFDMGYEYWFDANDGHNGIFFYDFAANTFFYTSPSFPFPYLYDFGLNTILYYFPDTQRPGHYTTNPRYFYNFATHQIITR